ncbi:MAG: DUF5685 family protein [Clostridiales bacterium]|nr:DUF5685 family protein [Clostridiales bacterium]HBM80083.1 hypothetical protein [Clostridiaceae bacterium]
MFGYIFPDKGELKVKEYELFKAYYCGLCKCIGRECGQAARLALNYDSAFLGMFLSSFREEREDIKFQNCAVHPFLKKPVIGESKAIKYASNIDIILTYRKLTDDLRDGHPVRSSVPMALFYSAYKKSSKAVPVKAKIIKEKLDELSVIEKQRCDSIDKAAEPFARLTEEIFAYPPLCEDKKREKSLHWFGYNIGKWIYIIDAYDDLEDDVKRKNYNPLLIQFCYNYNNEKIHDFKERIKGNVKFTLEHTLGQIGNAFDLMDIKKNKSIIENIIFGGMYKKTLQILEKRGCFKHEKSI